MEVGVRVRLRDVETFEDLEELRAPPPIEPADVVAGVEELYVVEVVLLTPPGARCVPVLASRTDPPPTLNAPD
jgi:hypothetical protein